MTNQSFSARKRRPSGMPQSQVLDLSGDRGLQVARIGGHHPHQMLGIARIVDPSNANGAPAVYAR